VCTAEKFQENDRRKDTGTEVNMADAVLPCEEKSQSQNVRQEPKEAVDFYFLFA
jgi:hypothetical protein